MLVFLYLCRFCAEHDWHHTASQSANTAWCNQLFLFSLCWVRVQCHQIYCKFFIRVTHLITCCVLCWWYGQCLGWYWQEDVQCLTHSSVYGLLCANTIQGELESSRFGQQRYAGLTYLILSAISFKIVSLGMYTKNPSFFPCFKSTMEVIFLNAVEYCLQFPLDVRYCFKKSSLQFHFQFGKEQNHRGGGGGG
jgi:hypothetical protein